MGCLQCRWRGKKKLSKAHHKRQNYATDQSPSTVRSILVSKENRNLDPPTSQKSNKTRTKAGYGTGTSSKLFNHDQTQPHFASPPHNRALCSPIRSGLISSPRMTPRAFLSPSRAKAAMATSTTPCEASPRSRKMLRHSGPLNTISALPPCKTAHVANSSFPFLLSPHTDEPLLCSRSVSSAGSVASSLRSAQWRTSDNSSGSSLDINSDPGFSTTGLMLPPRGLNFRLSGSLRDHYEDLKISGSLPLPPPPIYNGVVLRQFSWEELAGSCQNFSVQFWVRDGGAGPVYRAIVMDFSVGKKTEVAVTHLQNANHIKAKKWKVEVGSISRMCHTNLCRVIGYAASNGLELNQEEEDEEEEDDEEEEICEGEDGKLISERLLVYEHTDNGNLESLLYGRKDKAPIDWCSRMKIALGAAQGLAHLHERMPKQIIYESFKTLNIQVDKRLNAKLSDYGFSRALKRQPCHDNNHKVADPYMAPETRDVGTVTTKSNVWSFGVVLLELLTGRQHMDEMFPPEEQNLVEWALRPYLMLHDADKLCLIMDPELKGMYPTRDAKIVANLAMQCLRGEPSHRPTMRQSVQILKHITTPNNTSTVSSFASLCKSPSHTRLDSLKHDTSFTKSKSITKCIMSSPSRH